jgi:hypothetical protein
MIDEIETMFYDLTKKIQEDYNMKRVDASDIGLDYRVCGVMICDEGIMAFSPRDIEYYGGFEYIDDDLAIAVGQYKFYDAEASRVANCIKRWKESNEDEEEQGTE